MNNWYIDRSKNFIHDGLRDILSIINESELAGEEMTTAALSRKFEEALDDEDYDLARTLYNEMLEKYGSDNSEVKSAKFELDLDLGEDEG